MNNLDLQYQNLVNDILETGIEKSDRTGVGTKSVFGRTIRHRMSEGFPLLTTKKISFRLIAIELIWFLRGDTNIKFLIDNDCHIWTGDAYKKYERWFDDLQKKSKDSTSATGVILNSLFENKLSVKEFEKEIQTNEDFCKVFGDLGPIYGKQWRDCNSGYERDMGMSGVDQLQNLINDLKTNPDSRRMMVSAWQPLEIDQMVLPPCHYGFQVYTRELTTEERNEWYFNTAYKNPAYRVEWKDFELDQQNVPKRAISLMWNQRSVDTPLGLPFNIASYGLLLEIIARMVNMVPGELIANLGDTHIYLNQVDAIKEQLNRTPYDLPTLNISGVDLTGSLDDIIESLTSSNFQLENYQSHSSIKIQLSN